MTPVEAVTRKENELTSAERTGDAGVLAELLAADFLGITVPGTKVDRQRFIATFCSSGLKFEQMAIGDLEVRELGPVVVAVGRSTFAGTMGERSVTGNARFLDVWAPVDGEYRLTFSSATPIR